MALLKHTSVVSVATLASRILGYVRDSLIAMQLGAGIMNDLFIIALRLPNLFRSLFGEGAFSAAFVPLFSSVLVREGKESAKEFAQYVQSLLLLCLVAFCILLYIFMPQIITITAPGIVGNPEHYRLAIELARLTTPYLLLISMVTFYGGMLNSEHKYFGFAMAPILLNISLIVAALYAPIEKAVYILSYGVTVGGWLELIWIFIFAWRAGLCVPLRRPRINDQIRALFKRLWPCVIGSGVTQINVWVDTILASLLPNALSYLYYADRINQLPLALIGTALGTVLLPMLARHAHDGNTEKAIRLQNNAMDLGLFLAIPAAVGLHCISLPIVTVLFVHGEFGQMAAIKTAAALGIFAYGLPAYVLIKIFIASFYATGDTGTPAKLAVYCIIINVVVSLCLMPYIAHLAIATAATCSSWFNAIALGIILRKRQLVAVSTKQILFVLAYCFCALLMGIMLSWVDTHYYYTPLIQRVIMEVMVGGALYLAFAGYLRWVFRVR